MQSIGIYPLQKTGSFLFDLQYLLKAAAMRGAVLSFFTI